MKKKKILAVSGIRSDYDILYPALKELESSGFEVVLAVGNAHLSDLHGNTHKKIEQDGFKIADKIDCLLNTDRLTQRAKGVGLLVIGLSQCVEREKPDFLLVLGDREEAIATAIVGNYMDILTIHYGGGDPVYGNSDDTIRFATSKLAHIHITTTQSYMDNLIKVGEEPYRICNAGNTSYVNIKNVAWKDRKTLSKELNFDVESRDFFVFLKHPLSSEVNQARQQMQIALDSSVEFAKKNNLQIVGIRPNSDPGSYEILQVIDEFEKKYDFVRFFKTLPRETFINCIRHSLCLCGNSSMGILEAPFYKLPVVNVGNRQKGRLNAGNVEFVPYENEKIQHALQKACFDKEYREFVKNLKNPYGDESSAKKMAEFIKNIDINDRKWYVKTKLV